MVKKTLPKVENKNAMGETINMDLVLRVLQSKLLQNGDRIAEKCGDNAFEFVRDMQHKAQKYGYRLKISSKQWIFLKDIYNKLKGKIR